MNARAQYEAMLLNATFGQLYKAGLILPTIDGQPYIFGHIVMGEGENLPVAYDEGVALP